MICVRPQPPMKASSRASTIAKLYAVPSVRSWGCEVIQGATSWAITPACKAGIQGVTSSRDSCIAS